MFAYTGNRYINICSDGWVTISSHSSNDVHQFLCWHRATPPTKSLVLLTILMPVGEMSLCFSARLLASQAVFSPRHLLLEEWSKPFEVSFVKFVQCFPIYPHMIAFTFLNLNTNFTIAWLCENRGRGGGVREGEVGWWVHSKALHLRSKRTLLCPHKRIGDHALWTWGGWPSLVLV